MKDKNYTDTNIKEVCRYSGRPTSAEYFTYLDYFSLSDYPSVHSVIQSGAVHLLPVYQDQDITGLYRVLLGLDQKRQLHS